MSTPVEILDAKQFKDLQENPTIENLKKLKKFCEFKIHALTETAKQQLQKIPKEYVLFFEQLKALTLEIRQNKIALFNTLIEHEVLSLISTQHFNLSCKGPFEKGDLSKWRDIFKAKKYREIVHTYIDKPQGKINLTTAVIKIKLQTKIFEERLASFESKRKALIEGVKVQLSSKPQLWLVFSNLLETQTEIDIFQGHFIDTALLIEELNYQQQTGNIPNFWMNEITIPIVIESELGPESKEKETQPQSSEVVEEALEESQQINELVEEALEEGEQENNQGLKALGITIRQQQMVELFSMYVVASRLQNSLASPTPLQNAVIEEDIAEEETAPSPAPPPAKKETKVKQDPPKKPQNLTPALALTKKRVAWGQPTTVASPAHPLKQQKARNIRSTRPFSKKGS